MRSEDRTPLAMKGVYMDGDARGITTEGWVVGDTIYLLVQGARYEARVVSWDYVQDTLLIKLEGKSMGGGGREGDPRNI